MHFQTWFVNLKQFLDKEKQSLTEKMTIKLNEIVQFITQYCQFERKKIEFIDRDEAYAKD